MISALGDYEVLWWCGSILGIRSGAGARIPNGRPVLAFRNGRGSGDSPVLAFPTAVGAQWLRALFST